MPQKSSSNFRKQKSRNALGQIRRYVNALDEDDVYELLHFVREKITALHDKERKKSMRRFALGDRVSFPNNGEKILGTVIRLNAKTATVATKEGEWRIPPGILLKE